MSLLLVMSRHFLSGLVRNYTKMKRKEKEKYISQVVDNLKGQEFFFFSSFQGVKTGEINELRNKLRALSWEYRVVKNTLYQRVFKNLELENLDADSLDGFFRGPTALILEKSGKDKKSISPDNFSSLVGVSKILLAFVKNHPNFKVNAGFVSGRILAEKGVANLAKLPSREVLRQQLVNYLQLPLTRLVTVLNAPLRNFVYVLDAQSKKSS